MKNSVNLFGNSKKPETDACSESGGECAKVIEILQLIIDQEASKTEEDFFASHVGSCTSCLEKYELEKSLMLEIRSKIQARTCPDEIVKSIKSKLKQTTL